MRRAIQLNCPKEAEKILQMLEQGGGKGWQQQRLRAMSMAAQGRWSLQQIADAVGAGRSTVGGWLKIIREKNLSTLLQWKPGQGAPASLSKEVQKALCQELVEGQWRRARDIQQWLLREHQAKMGLGGVYYWLKKAGGVLKVPRKTHAKKDAALGEIFKEQLAEKLASLSLDVMRPVRVWVADEHRYGLISVVRKVWTLRGLRPKADYHTKYQWGYLYSALEVDGAHDSQALFTNSVSLEHSGRFLEQIVASDPQNQHVVIWDRAGFHPGNGHEVVPQGVHLLPLPPYSPELNPVEQIGRFIRDAVGNQAWQSLAQIEAAIEAELQPVWKEPSRVARLIGNNWLTNQLNVTAQQE